jgi:release factor glutamine methyltransferase
MKIREAENWIRESISSVYAPGEAANIASLLVEYVSGYDPHKIKTNREEDILSLDQEVLSPLIERLRAHEPIQYIMNRCWFYGMELYVDPAVLIPRPETEELVEWVLDDLKKTSPDLFEKHSSKPDETTRLKIMDACTGSGCIALAIKKNVPLAEVWGTDISEEALNVARRNGASLDIRVDFQGMDFLDLPQQKLLPSVDIVVSNPPYIPRKDKASMQPNVLLYEPTQALFVPDEDALIFYKALLHYCGHRLHENGRIYMEVHENLANEVKELFTTNGYVVEVKKDMQGKERMVRAKK